MSEPVRQARRLLAENQYLTMATADASGRPWATTVWYTAVQPSQPADALDLQLIWLSWPETRHSRNLLERPEVGMSIFDSTQPAGTGDGLQLAAHAGLVPPADLDDAVAAFSAASLAAGGGPWTRTDVEEPAVPRLYVARIETAYFLSGKVRLEVPLT